MHRFISLAFVGSLVLSACGGGGSDGAGGGGGGGGSTTASASGTGAAATTATGSGGAEKCDDPCNDLPLPAQVSKTADPGPPPAFTGGEIPDGTYVVTSIVNFGTTTPGPTKAQEAYRFSAGKIEVAVASTEDPEVHFCGTYSTSGNKVKFELACPLAFTVELGYSCDGTTFAFEHGSNPGEVAFATKQ